jgi:hypothetical protein
LSDHHTREITPQRHFWHDEIFNLSARSGIREGRVSALGIQLVVNIHLNGLYTLYVRNDDDENSFDSWTSFMEYIKSFSQARLLRLSASRHQ